MKNKKTGFANLNKKDFVCCAWDRRNNSIRKEATKNKRLTLLRFVAVENGEIKKSFALLPLFLSVQEREK